LASKLCGNARIFARLLFRLGALDSDLQFFEKILSCFVWKHIPKFNQSLPRERDLDPRQASKTAELVEVPVDDLKRGILIHPFNPASEFLRTGCIHGGGHWFLILN
jgi:hypothetical protein